MNSGNWDTALWEPIKQHRRGMAFIWVIYSFITLKFTRYLFTKNLSVDRIYISDCTISVITRVWLTSSTCCLTVQVLIKQGYSFSSYFFDLVSSVNRTCTHAFATIKISILWNQLIDRNSRVSSVNCISSLKPGFRVRFNYGFRHFIVRHCNASLLRWYSWEESKLPVWPPSTVHGVAHLRLVTQNTEPVWKSFPKKTCPIVRTCTKSMLNYPSRRWGLESTQNSMYRSLSACSWRICMKLTPQKEVQEVVSVYFSWPAIEIWEHTSTHTHSARPQFSPYSA